MGEPPTPSIDLFPPADRDPRWAVRLATGEPRVLRLRRWHWIEIELRDAGGRPAAGEPFAVEFADGSPRLDGVLDQGGFARFERLARGGPCEVIFPRRWKGDVVAGAPR